MAGKADGERGGQPLSHDAVVAQLLERVSDAFVALDRDWRYTYVNERAGELFHRRPEALLGKHIWTEFPEGGGQPFHLAYERAMAEQQPVFLEDYYAPWDRWFENRIYPSPAGLSIFFHEITDRKRAELRLAEGEARLRAILDGLYAFVALMTAEGVLVEVNRAALRLGSGGRDEVLGTRLGESAVWTRSPQALARVRAALARAVAGETVRYDDQLSTASGQAIALDMSLSPVRDARDQVTHVLAFATDITERRAAEQAARESANRLRELSARVLAVQEEERRRLAHEFHDQLGQTLTALRMQLEARGRLPPGSVVAPEADTASVALVDGAIAEVRRLALALRPSLLDDLGLPPALRWAADQLCAPAGIAVQLHASLPPERLAPGLETALFRIAQEALTNVARHAHGSRVEITLAADDDTISLCVEDDGLGFDVAQACERATLGESLGVLGMQERVRVRLPLRAAASCDR